MPHIFYRQQAVRKQSKAMTERITLTVLSAAAAWLYQWTWGVEALTIEVGDQYGTT